MAGVQHEVYAILFARNDEPTRGHLMLPPADDPHDAPMPLAYYAWLIRSPEQDIVVDAGVTEVTNGTRPRTIIERPGVALGRLGVDTQAVSTVILTHFHNDHVGDLEAFGSATFVAQRAEYEFWTSEEAWQLELSRYGDRADIARLTDLYEAGRLTLIDGTVQIADGVTVHHVGGHTPGMQVTVVRTAGGPLVLASDASHFFENIEENHPTAVNLEPEGALGVLATLRSLGEGGRVVAGHDPALLDRFPAVPGLEGRALRIA